MKKSRISKRMTHLCGELKTQLDNLDKIQVKSQEPTPAQKRQILFKELKEKLENVSK